MGAFARPIPVMDKGRSMTNPAIDRLREEMLHARRDGRIGGAAPL